MARGMRFARWWAALGLGVGLGILLAVLLVSRWGAAQVQLVTVPGRDAVELTIYSSQALTYAKEQRNITLREGENLIQFSWSGTQIDPTSVQLKSLSAPENVLVKEAILPPNLENAILWRVESKQGGAHLVEVSYFIQGLTWDASYIAYVDARESSLRLIGNFTVYNHSGEDYADAVARLVVGDIRLIPQEELRQLFSAEVAGAARAPAAARQRAERRMAFRKLQASSLAEYYMFTVPGTNTFESGWTKRIAAFDVSEISVRVAYKYDPAQGRVRRFYTFENRAEDGLGQEPLPAGTVRVFMVDGSGHVSFIGQSDIPFTPIGAEVELDLGVELAVTVKREEMDYAMLHLGFNDDGDLAFYDEERTIRIEARNFRPERISLEIPERLPGQWEILEKSHEYEQKDRNTIQFTVELEPGETEQISYRYRQQVGR